MEIGTLASPQIHIIGHAAEGPSCWSTENEILNNYLFESRLCSANNEQ
jgi:hypothetical protein